ncbi:MAG: DotI/IcmL family type IV secretion protein [Candidatus Berkiella sp.]
MRKLLLLTALASMPLWADTANDIADIQIRLKQIEVRLGLIERDLSEVRGSKVDLVPLSQSSLPSSSVLIWASESIEQIYDYNYKNFPQVLTAIRKYFTTQGYDSYMKALNDSNNLQIVQDKRMYVSGKVSQRGKVVKEGVVSGIYTWEIEIPLDVTYKTSTDTVTQKIMANIEVVRVPIADSQVGVAIHSITAKPVSEGETTPAAPSSSGGVTLPSAK